MLLKSGKQDQLNYYIYDDRRSSGEAAGNAAAELILEELKTKEVINMIFAAAPSQNEILQTLVARSDIPWDRIRAFHMDEYIGLSADAPQCFSNFLKEAIFERVPFRSVYYIDASAVDSEQECRRYAALLQEYPVDIVCLGIGENGHIAFNDPWVADFNDPELIKPVPLDEVCRKQQVNDGCFASLEDVPTHALTLTIPALLRAKHMICTVPAATKRWAVRETILGSIGEACPATSMRRHPSAAMYCDAMSGADLL